MIAKTEAQQNQSTNVSINEVIENILVKNPEKYLDTSYVKKTITDNLVKSNQEMVTYVQHLIKEFIDFK